MPADLRLAIDSLAYLRIAGRSNDTIFAAATNMPSIAHIEYLATRQPAVQRARRGAEKDPRLGGGTVGLRLS